MRFDRAALCMIVGLVCTNSVLAQQAAKRSVPVATGGTIYSAAVTQAVVHALTQKIAELEVERALLEPVRDPSHPELRRLEASLQGLHNRLLQLRPDGNQVAIAAATTKAVEARVPALEVRLAIAEATHDPSDHRVKTPQAQLQSLRSRLAILRQVARAKRP